MADPTVPSPSLPSQPTIDSKCHVTRPRKQKGYVFRKGNSWFLRYWDSVVENGKLIRKQRCKNLAPVEDAHRRLKRPPDQVIELAEAFLQPLNSASYDSAKNLTLGDFAKNVWLSQLRNRVSASTIDSTEYYWNHILVPRCGSALLRDFSTPAAQALLNEIGRQNPSMRKATLHKLKSLLSSIFKLAIQQGYMPKGSANPIRETSLPRAPEGEETYAYSLEEVLDMLAVIPEPSRTVIAIAAFAGLRRSEIQGLVWESYNGETLKVVRSVWEGIAGEPKSKYSKGAVPVIAALRNILDQFRLRAGNPPAGIMFPAGNGSPLRMNNLLNDQILPVLNACKSCGEPEGDHTGADHKYQRNGSRPEWHGFHAFRRGLATNLHDLGVDDKTIQAILRHGNVAVTQRCYIKTLPQQSIAAMQKLDTLVGSMCNQRATATKGSGLIN